MYSCVADVPFRVCEKSGAATQAVGPLNDTFHHIYWLLCDLFCAKFVSQSDKNNDWTFSSVAVILLESYYIELRCLTKWKFIKQVNRAKNSWGYTPGTWRWHHMGEPNYSVPSYFIYVCLFVYTRVCVCVCVCVMVHYRYCRWRSSYPNLKSIFEFH